MVFAGAPRRRPTTPTTPTCGARAPRRILEVPITSATAARAAQGRSERAYARAAAHPLARRARSAWACGRCGCARPTRRCARHDRLRRRACTRAGAPCFNIIFHSSELLPGGSPYTPDAGQRRRASWTTCARCSSTSRARLGARGPHLRRVRARTGPRARMNVLMVTPHLPPHQAANALLPAPARPAASRERGHAVRVPDLRRRGTARDGVAYVRRRLAAAARDARAPGAGGGGDLVEGAGRCSRRADVVHVHSSTWMNQVAARLAVRARQAVRAHALRHRDLAPRRQGRRASAASTATRATSRFYSRALLERARELAVSRCARPRSSTRRWRTRSGPCSGGPRARCAGALRARGRRRCSLNVKRLHPAGRPARRCCEAMARGARASGRTPCCSSPARGEEEAALKAQAARAAASATPCASWASCPTTRWRALQGGGRPVRALVGAGGDAHRGPGGAGLRHARRLHRQPGRRRAARDLRRRRERWCRRQDPRGAGRAPCSRSWPRRGARAPRHRATHRGALPPARRGRPLPRALPRRPAAREDRSTTRAIAEAAAARASAASTTTRCSSTCAAPR